MHARVTRGERKTIADGPPHPAVVVVAVLGEHRSDRERRARMHGRKRGAGIAPVVDLRRLVGAATTRGVLEQLSTEHGEPAGLEHCVAFLVAIVIVQQGCDRPGSAEHGECRQRIPQRVRVLRIGVRREMVAHVVVVLMGHTNGRDRNGKLRPIPFIPMQWRGQVIAGVDNERVNLAILLLLGKTRARQQQTEERAPPDHPHPLVTYGCLTGAPEIPIATVRFRTVFVRAPRELAPSA